jgi:predicted outer membrane protein
MPRATHVVGVALLSLAAAFVVAQDNKAGENKAAPPPLGTASFTPPEGNTQLQPLTPANFVTRAAVANMAEIDASRLALEKSADPELRKFAARLVTDHQAAQAKLKTVAGAAKIALPGTVDEEHRLQKEKLQELTGADFNKQYLVLMRAGHEQAMKLFDMAAKSSDLDAALKSYAGETLKTVKAHAVEAEKLHARH